MKKFICGLLIGVIISSLVGAYAVNHIYDNPYPIYVNGEPKQIQGYNIDGYSYFKLRDIAQATNKFDVNFRNNNVIINTSSQYSGEEPNNIVYYDFYKCSWLPDYGAYIGIDYKDFIENNGVSDNYIYFYPYDENHINGYINLLVNCGFTLDYLNEDLSIYRKNENSYSVVYKEGTPVLKKDGNYVTVEKKEPGGELEIEAMINKSPYDTIQILQQFNDKWLWF